eukprot:scaffold328634_cov28-Attheya_sp.AAC.2
MSPKLIMKLKQQSNTGLTNNNESVQQRVAVAMSLQSALNDTSFGRVTGSRRTSNTRCENWYSMSCRNIG